MASGPGGKYVECPECGAEAIAIVPSNSDLTEDATDADGKVWVNCRNCGDRFLVHYRFN